MERTMPFLGNFSFRDYSHLTRRPLLDLVVSFSELGIYWSQTRSTRDTSALYVVMMCGIQTEWAYSENVLALPGFNIWTIAAPASATAVTAGASVVDDDSFSKHFSRSLLHTTYTSITSGMWRRTRPIFVEEEVVQAFVPGLAPSEHPKKTSGTRDRPNQRQSFLVFWWRRWCPRRKRKLFTSFNHISERSFMFDQSFFHECIELCSSKLISIFHNVYPFCTLHLLFSIKTSPVNQFWKF